MSYDNTATRHPSSGHVAILLGLAGLGAGVAAMLTGVDAFGLAAGIAALAAPTWMLREVGRGMQEPVEREADLDSLGPTPVQPFYMDSELLTAEYFDISVKNRLTAARRFLKPLTIVQLQVRGDAPDEELDGKASAAVLDTLRECDTAYVMGTGCLALILEDTPESGAVWAVERIRRSLSSADERLTLRAGLACYPAHGMNTQELIAQCADAFERAQDWPQGRIEVAFAD